MSEFIECTLGTIKKGTVDAILRENFDCYRIPFHLYRIIIKFTDRETVRFDYTSEYDRDEVYNELVSKLYKDTVKNHK